jgi:hypothetical protein
MPTKSLHFTNLSPAAKVHGWLLDVLPKNAGLVLKVGAGSGRDARGSHRWVNRS